MRIIEAPYESRVFFVSRTCGRRSKNCVWDTMRNTGEPLHFLLVESRVDAQKPVFVQREVLIFLIEHIGETSKKFIVAHKIT